jgi:hypothetical protein
LKENQFYTLSSFSRILTIATAGMITIMSIMIFGKRFS